jgi:HSP20 family protein
MKATKIESCDSIYPGVLSTKEDINELKRKFNCGPSDVHKPKVRIKEQRNFMEIEVSVPGIEKEDVYAEIKNEILTIRVYHCEKNTNEKNNLKKNRYQRQVRLPKNADVLFTTAEYKNGVLKFFIPKSQNTEMFNNERVVIY